MVPVAELGVPARQALAYARAVARDDAHVVAVHMTDDVATAENLRRQWQEWGRGGFEREHLAEGDAVEKAGLVVRDDQAAVGGDDDAGWAPPAVPVGVLPARQKVASIHRLLIFEVDAQ